MAKARATKPSGLLSAKQRRIRQRQATLKATLKSFVVDGGDTFLVNEVGSCTIGSKHATWLVSWKGYGSDHDTQEPMENLITTPWVAAAALCKLKQAKESVDLSDPTFAFTYLRTKQILERAILDAKPEPKRD